MHTTAIKMANMDPKIINTIVPPLLFDPVSAIPWLGAAVELSPLSPVVEVSDWLSVLPSVEGVVVVLSVVLAEMVEFEESAGVWSSDSSDSSDFSDSSDSSDSSATTGTGTIESWVLPQVSSTIFRLKCHEQIYYSMRWCWLHKWQLLPTLQVECTYKQYQCRMKWLE